jgi:Na+-transporting NADH:ubiquinone oxidoreductase subunit NqrF
MVNDEEVLEPILWQIIPPKENIVKLTVRIATHRLVATKDWMDVNPGIASSYIYSKSGR